MAVQLRVTEATETYGMVRSTISRLHELLAREMEDEVGMPFERYSVLLMLAQADGGALRPSELAEALPITSSGVTRLIDRLERDGVVERRACATDGRGTLVAMTADGTEVFRRAGRVHLRGIDEHLGANLTGSEMAELRRIMAKLAAAIDAIDATDATVTADLHRRAR